MLNRESTAQLVVMSSNSKELSHEAKQMNDDIIQFMRKRSRDPLCGAKYTTLVHLERKRQKAMRARREPALRPSLYSSRKRGEEQDERAPPKAEEPAPVERRRSEQHSHSRSLHHSHSHSHEPPADRRRGGDDGGGRGCRPKKPKCGGKSHRKRSSRRDGCKKRKRSSCRRRSKCKAKRRRSKNRCAKKAKRHRSRAHRCKPRANRCKPKRKRRC